MVVYMPRTRKPPRLWLRPSRPNSSATWLILDGNKQISTGCTEQEFDKARIALDRYIDSLPINGFIKTVPVDVRKKLDEIAATYSDSTRGYVYFLSTNAIRNYPIKIGFTREHRDSRISDLQTGCPYPLRVLARAKGSVWIEKELHKRFQADQLIGEWFARSPELMGLINLVNRDPDPNILIDEVKSRWENTMHELVGRAGLEPATRVL